MNDGTTPLILAARLAVEGMVAELVNCQADVNAVDDHGKSALHWAAAVNNVEATLLLLKNGANRDMQDNKEETPLFLAAREGSYEAARILLDHFANRDITDHMDRLPRDVARDRMHHDIVRLLSEYNVAHSPPGTVLAAALSPAALCGPNRPFLNLKPTPMGKKPRRPSAKGAVPSSLPNLAREPKDPRSGGRRKKNLGEKGQLSESSVTLSPVDSLESPHAYGSDATPSPMITSPGILQASPSPLLAPGSLPSHAQHTVSFSSLHEMQPLARGAGPVLPSVSQLLSHRLAPPGGGGGSLGRLHPVNVPADWMSRLDTNEAQYGEMFGRVLVPAEGPCPSAAPPTGPGQPDGKQAATSSREPLPPIVTFHLLPKGGGAQAAGLPQVGCPPAMAGPLGGMYQIPDLARMQGVAYPAAVLPQQDGPASQTVLPAYHPFPSSVGKYPTPPSQHSYASSTGAERTPSHNGNLQGEHPYLTPSPESPDQWSSSSPHSASDWSDVTTSPAPRGGANSQRGPGARGAEPPPRSNTQVFA
uniref:Notch C-terminal domain-containing protein n=2 Tax=Ornithorhynchus anatinus TaxID=9258 RepID=F7DG27_ORNAN